LLNVCKRLGQWFEVYATVRNILNAPFALIQDSDRKGTINEVDEAIFRFRHGQLAGGGMSINL